MDETAHITAESSRPTLQKRSRAGGPITCVSFGGSSSSTSLSSPSNDNVNFLFAAQGPYVIRYPFQNDHATLSGIETKGVNQEERLLAFADGGTVHGLHFFSNEPANVNSDDHDHHRRHRPFDAVLYGGKKIAFGNLLSKTPSLSSSKMTVFPTILSSGPSSSTSTATTTTSAATSLELSDWIWSIEEVPSNSTVVQPETLQSQRIVVGFARHMLEFWEISWETSTNIETEDLGTKTCLNVKRLSRLHLHPTTLVTSMDLHHFLGNDDDNSRQWLTVASGDSFYNVWVTRIDLAKSNGIADPAPSHRNGFHGRSHQHQNLQGHKGVVHDVKFSKCGLLLASCSDDRSVRLWRRTSEHTDASNNSNDQDDDHIWKHEWVGWGHTARIWNVAFVQRNKSSSPKRLASVSEDGTARLWSLETGENVACLHHVSASSSLWKIDTCWEEEKIVVGSTDGVASMYDLNDHVAGVDGGQEGMVVQDLVPVPDDRPKTAVEPISEEQPDESTVPPNVVVKGENASDTTNVTRNGRKKKTKASRKAKAQVIVGMKWWKPPCGEPVEKMVSSYIIIATRQGSLLSCNAYAVLPCWTDLGVWWEPTLKDRFGIQAADGCCMAVESPTGKHALVAVGTTRGDVVLTLLAPRMECESQNEFCCVGRSVLLAREQKSVQGMEWVKEETGDAFWLISYHVKTVALWKVPSVEAIPSAIPEPSIVLNPGANEKGVPSCCVYDQRESRVVIGDTRGNLSLFMLGESTGTIGPSAMIPRVHQKQHVTSICLRNHNSILSAGNDGYLHTCYIESNSLEKGWSFPVPCMTGITDILCVQDSIVVSGYYGNVFLIMDVITGHEFLRVDTGGRQRILDCVSTYNDFFLYSLAVSMGQSDGTNTLLVQGLRRPSIPGTKTKQLSLGVNMHGETIFGSSFFTLGSQSTIFLVSGSEDCTSKVSAWRGCEIVDSITLSQQESCVRCITTSQVDQESVLVAVGGGSLVLQFFLIRLLPSSTGNSVHDLQIYFMGKGTASKKKATMDHRINAVKGIPLLGNTRDHLVVSGDSNGNAQLYLIPEDTRQGSKSTLGLLAPTSARPILCVEIVAIASRNIILVGTTGGDILLYDMPADSIELHKQWKDVVSEWKSIVSYQGHQMGTNAISARLVLLRKNENNGRDTGVIHVVSGGDDQGLCVSEIVLHVTAGGCRLEQEVRLYNVPGASFSAIKGVSQLILDGRPYFLCTGYSQMISLWIISDPEDDNMSLSPSVTSKISVDLGDVNCLSVCSGLDCRTYAVVCGMGAELFEIQAPNRVKS